APLRIRTPRAKPRRHEPPHAPESRTNAPRARAAAEPPGAAALSRAVAYPPEAVGGTGRRRRADRGPGSARHHHRERGDPAYARHVRRHLGSDHLGAYLIPRVSGSGDAAYGLSLRETRTAPPLDLLHRRLRDLLGTVRRVVEPRKHGDLPAGARHLRRAARALEPGHPARRLPEGEARPGARHLRPWHHGGSRPRT